MSRKPTQINSPTHFIFSGTFSRAMCSHRAASRSAPRVARSKQKLRRALGETQSRQHRPDRQIEARTFTARSGKAETADIVANPRSGGEHVPSIVQDRAALMELAAINVNNGALRGDRFATGANRRSLACERHQVARSALMQPNC